MIVLLTGLAAQAATKYQINVAGVEVTSDNASYITGGDISSGYASYNASSNTLTLHSITITRDSGDGNYALHNRDCSGLIIKCEGTCRLTTRTAHTIHMDKTTKIQVTSGSSLDVAMTYASSSSTAALYSKNNSDIYIWGPGRTNIETWGSSGNYPRAIMGEGSNPYLYFDDLANVTIKSAGYSIYNYKVYAYSASRDSWGITIETKNGYNAFYNVAGLVMGSSAVAVWPADCEVASGYLYDEDGAAMTKLGIANPNNCLPFNKANFPDYNFRHWLRSNLDNSYFWGIHALNLEYLDRFTQIDCHGQSISSLQGIEKFTYLQTLKCYNNSITSLDLSSNTALTYLSCYGNDMTSLNVNSCTNLTYLDCAPNSLTSLNVSNLSRLQTLYCYNNRLTSLILPSSSSSSLQTLSCYNNNFSSLSVTSHSNLTSLDASNNPSMISLYCYGNKLSSLNVKNCPALQTLKCYGSNNTYSTLDLTGTTALTYLDCGPCPNLSSITNLSNCTGMKTLICYESKLSDLSAVNSMSNLESLDCHSTKITSLSLTYKSKLTSVNCSSCTSLTSATIYSNSALTTLNCNGCSAMTYLACNDNKLSSLTVTNCPALTTMRCYGSNQTFTTLNLSGTSALTFLDCQPCPSLTSISYLGSCTALKTLYCGTTAITSLDLANLSNLESLWCSASKLTSLSLTNKTKLTSLSCTNIPTMTSLTVTSTPLTSINVSGNTGLTSLKCSSNSSLSSISNLSACTNLTYLDCQSCNLSSLDVTALTKLQTIYCSNNKLTSLNVSSKTNLTYLSCKDNLLTSLNVQGCTKLENLYCYNNRLTSLYLQGCTALKLLSCYRNQITGSGMTTLVGSLPNRSSSARGTLYAVDDTNEGNTMTSAQITTAQNKYWAPMERNGSSWIEMSAVQTGDVNGDGQVTIADVTELIDSLLSGLEVPTHVADVNGDGQVTIADVTELIDRLLSGN